MTALNKHLEQGENWIEVEAGMLTRDMNKHLRKAGLMVPSLPIYEGMTVGGMAATGSHGSSLQHASLSDQVLEMTIVRPDGESVRVTRQNPETWRAACLSLGLLGVVYSLRLKCEPAQQLETHDVIMPLEKGLRQMAQFVREFDHVSAYVIPYNKTMWFYIANRTNRPVDFTARRRAANYARQYAWFRGLPLIMKSLARFWPGVIHTALLSAGGFLRTTNDVRRSDHAYHYLATFPNLVDSEYVLPIAHAEDAYRFLIETVEAWAKQKRYPINMAFHARFIKGSGAYLSPTRGYSSICIEAATAANQWNDEFYRAWGDDMMQRFDARPHWGKGFYNLPMIREQYRDGLRAFNRIRQKFDPSNRMLNPALREIFCV
jgi:L-gulonolactone oxidase